jgi:hypothetical protein
MAQKTLLFLLVSNLNLKYMKTNLKQILFYCLIPTLGYLASCGSSDPTPVKSLNISFSGFQGATSDSSATLQIGQTLNLNINLSSSDDRLASMTLTKVVIPRGSTTEKTEVIGEITRTRDFDNDRVHTYRTSYTVSSEDALLNGPVQFRVRLTNTKNGFAVRSFLLTVQQSDISIGFLNADGTPADSVVTRNVGRNYTVQYFAATTGELKKIEFNSVGTDNVVRNMTTFEGNQITDKKYFLGTQILSNLDARVKNYEITVEDATGKKRTRILYLADAIKTTTPAGGTQHLLLGTQSNALVGSFVQFQDGAIPLVRNQTQASNAANSGTIIMAYYKTTDTNQPSFCTAGDNTANNPFRTVFSSMNPKLSTARIKATSGNVYDGIKHALALEKATKSSGSPERTSVNEVQKDDAFFVYDTAKGFYLVFKVLAVGGNDITLEFKYVEK